MKIRKFSEAFSEINEKYIEEAANYKKSGKTVWLKITAVAACLALVIAGASLLIPQNELPVLRLSESDFGMGFEGYELYDISELVIGNPWSKTDKISTLPVYKNTVFHDENGVIKGGDFDKMRELLLETAELFGIDTESSVITDDSPSEETKQKIIEKYERIGSQVPEGLFDPTTLIIETDEYKISVNQNMIANIDFKNPVALPQGYNFSHRSTYQEALEVAEYLKTEYAHLLNMQNPQTSISGGDYNIYGEQSYRISFFEASKSVRQSILNYTFDYVSFSQNDEGRLDRISIHKADLSQTAGEYPIISAKEAEELLLNGNYFTSVSWKEIRGKEYIGKVELVYMGGINVEYKIPFYKFYVELDFSELERPEGMKTYGAFYVPAIEAKYIENMPHYQGEFN